MRTSVLITNNSPRHPAWKWAEVTAQQLSDLIEVDENSSSPQAREGRRAKVRLQSDLQDVLEAHYTAAQSEEVRQLSTGGPDRLLADYAPHKEHHENAVKAIYDVLDRPDYVILRPHFNQEHVRDFVEKHVGKHMVSQQHIERLAHANANKETSQAKTFLARHVGEEE